MASCTQRGRFFLGDTLEALQPDGTVVSITPEWIKNEAGEEVNATPHPMMHYTIPCKAELMPYTLLRAPKKPCPTEVADPNADTTFCCTDC